jgi:hypothetical protein
VGQLHHVSTQTREDDEGHVQSRLWRRNDPSSPPSMRLPVLFDGALKSLVHALSGGFPNIVGSTHAIELPALRTPVIV